MHLTNQILSQKKSIQYGLLLLAIGLTHIVSGQTATQNLNMGLYQVQFESASGGSNTIQSFGGSVYGTWLFKSRFDHLVLDAGVNAPNARKIYFRTGGVERAIFTSTGEFGIGTTTPQTLLDIKANADNQDLLRLSHPTSPGAAGLIVGFGQNSSSNNNGSVEVKVEFSDAIYDVLAINRHNRDFYYKGGGKVGIGTDAPQVALDVKASSSNQNLLRLSHPTTPDAAGLIFGFGRNKDLVDNGSVGLKVEYGSVEYEVIGVNRVNRDFYYIGDGNVGIGTNDPQSKLAVDGTIRATEIKVMEVIGAPDYVFEADYNLRTLEATKAYIEENKHLPEIPSAAEMEANGIELGDMNMRLLKKIEELTLYMIEINKQVQELKAENQSLKAQISH